MKFIVEIRDNGSIWLTSDEIDLTTCAFNLFQFEKGNWFIEISTKQNNENGQEFEDVLLIQITNDGKRLFIDGQEIIDSTTIENNHYSIYVEKDTEEEDKLV
jgi:hypothetical protein